MEPQQGLGHGLPVLPVGHAEPLPGGGEEGDLQRSPAELLVHHLGQKPLGPEIVSGGKAESTK